MSIPPPSGFSWTDYGAYAAFDRFLQRFVIERKSFVTNHSTKLDVAAALADINRRFVDGFDDGEDKFDEKASMQFATASDNTRIFFANAEYLWAMPSGSLTPRKKRGYALRWFGDGVVNKGADFYFNGEEGIANPGQYYQTNKYQELLALFRLFSHLFSDPGMDTVARIKGRLGELCHEALYGKLPPHGGFGVDDYCGVHAALLHLSNPDKYESIISKANKQQILGAFEHIIADRPDGLGAEEKIRLIRERLYGDYNLVQDAKRKYRWFFYGDDVKVHWLTKSVRQQKEASINDEIQRELNATEVEDEEGRLKPTQGFRHHRSSKLVAKVKKRDGHSCKACGFHFMNEIVHVHHLDPLSERLKPEKTREKDLITLCPNCHYMAHYLLRKTPGPQYKDRNRLLGKLATILPKR